LQACRPRLGPPPPTAAVRVVRLTAKAGGFVAARDCLATLDGTSPATATAIVVAGTSARASVIILVFFVLGLLPVPLAGVAVPQPHIRLRVPVPGAGLEFPLPTGVTLPAAATIGVLARGARPAVELRPARHRRAALPLEAARDPAAALVAPDGAPRLRTARHVDVPPVPAAPSLPPAGRLEAMRFSPAPAFLAGLERLRAVAGARVRRLERFPSTPGTSVGGFVG
jgi:hypothetical protein